MQELVELTNAKRESAQISTMFTEVESIDDYMRKSEQLGAKIVKSKKAMCVSVYIYLS